ncbi:MAG: PAS domain-containing protein [Vicinamibacterales bacterium]
MAGRHNPDLIRLRRRLRGVPPATLLQTLQEQLETFDVAAIAADNTGRYVAANTRMSELTGYSRADLLRLQVKDITPAMRHDLAGNLWNRFIQNGTQTGEYVLLRKDGTPIGVQYAAYASVAPGVHLSLVTPLELPSSI